MKKAMMFLMALSLVFVFGATCYADTSETEPNNDKSTADPLVSGEGMVGQLSSSSDQDWYSISTSGAAVIDVSFTAPKSSSGFLYYAWSISVQDPSGAVLGAKQHPSTSASTQFSTAVTGAGTYYVKITSSSWSDKNYTLTVTPTTGTTTSETEPNNDKSTADPLVSGEGMVGQLSSSSDQDWYSISTSGAAVIDVSFTAPKSSSGFLYYAWSISVQDPSGAVLGAKQHPSTSASTQFSTAVTGAGTYYVKITSSSWSDKNYTLTVTPTTGTTTSETEPNNDKSTADPLVSGEGMVGQLSSSSDQDWYSISTSGAAVIDVSFTAPKSSSGFLYYAWSISVQDPSGAVLGAKQHPSTSASTQFSTAVTGAGTYYVKITSSSWSDKNYTLTVTPTTGTTTTTTSTTSTSTSTTSTSTTSSTPSSSSTTTSFTSSTTSTSSTTTTTIPPSFHPFTQTFMGHVMETSPVTLLYKKPSTTQPLEVR